MIKSLMQALIKGGLFAVIVTLGTFLLLKANPTDPAEAALRANAIVPTSAAIHLEQHRLGLDQPVLVQYGHWVQNALHGDFGHSYVTRQPVAEMIAAALPNTLWLAVVTFGIIVVTTMLFGWLAARWPNSWLEGVARLVLFVLNAIPPFWLGLLLIMTVALTIPAVQVSGNDRPSAVILPALTLAASYVATYGRLIRQAVMSNRNAPFMRYYRLRGFSAQEQVRHLLKNSLRSTLTAMSMSLPKLIAGAVIVENVFSWPGMGTLCIRAITNRDMPVLQTYIALMTLLFVISDGVLKIGLRKLDPRLADSEVSA